MSKPLEFAVESVRVVDAGTHNERVVVDVATSAGRVVVDVRGDDEAAGVGVDERHGRWTLATMSTPRDEALRVNGVEYVGRVDVESTPWGVGGSRRIVASAYSLRRRDDFMRGPSESAAAALSDMFERAWASIATTSAPTLARGAWLRSCAEYAREAVDDARRVVDEREREAREAVEAAFTWERDHNDDGAAGTLRAARGEAARA